MCVNLIIFFIFRVSKEPYSSFFRTLLASCMYLSIPCFSFKTSVIDTNYLIFVKLGRKTIQFEEISLWHFLIPCHQKYLLSCKLLR